MRTPVQGRAALALVCVLLAAAPAMAATKPATKGADGRVRISPVALLGWCAALVALVGAALAASNHVAPSRQERAERARIATLLASLEEAQRARLAERERNGLRRRRPARDDTPRPADPARFEGGFSFLTRARSQPPRCPPPPVEPPAPERAPAPAAPASDSATTKASEQLALLLDAIVAAEHRLATLRAELKQADERQTLDVDALATDLSNEVLARLQTLGAVASSDSMQTLNLGPLDLPGDGTLDLGKLDLPDDVLDRLRALAEVTVTDGTVDLGPLELPGSSTLTALPRELLTRLEAPVAAGHTVVLGPPDLPG